MIRERWLVVLGLYLGAASGVAAQGAGAPSPAGGTPAALPELRLPSVQDLRASLPRSAKAAAALADIGLTRLYDLQGGITAWATEIDPSVPVY